MNLKEWKKKVKIIGIIQSENYSERVKMAMRNLKSSGAKYRRASNHSGYSQSISERSNDKKSAFLSRLFKGQRSMSPSVD